MNISERNIDWGTIRETVRQVFENSPNIKILSFRSVDGPDEMIATIEIGDDRKDLIIIFGSSGEPRMIKQKIFELRREKEMIGGYPVYMAPYISENSRKIAIQEDIGLIDLSGNAFLVFDNVLIDRIGFENRYKKKRTMKKLFSRKSTRIIRKLLSSYRKEWKITELAEQSEVSNGFVSMVMKNLEKEGFIDRQWGSIKLIEHGDLLDRWSEEYRFSKQKITGYFCPQEKREKVLDQLRDINERKYALTMGVGVSLIAPHVRSTDIYIYSTDDPMLVEKLNLKPVEFGGNLQIITPYDIGVFFDRQMIDGLSVVSNIQLYLDLYKYPARGREQALFLRENVMEI